MTKTKYSKIYHVHIKATGEDLYFSQIKQISENLLGIAPAYSSLKRHLKDSDLYQNKKCLIKIGKLQKSSRGKYKRVGFLNNSKD